MSVPPGYNREEWELIAETAEEIVRLQAHDDWERATQVWEQLSERQQRLLVAGLAAMVAHYRLELFGPDPEFGPEP